MKRNYRLYAEDIVSCIDSIFLFIGKMSYDDFIKDDKTSSAVVRKIEIIGEAAKNIPQNIRILEPDIPWKEISGMRDVIAHFYFGIDYKVVWEVCMKRLPDLKVRILSLLEKMD